MSPGDPLTADRLAFLLRRPYCNLRQDVAQNITTGGSFQPITFDAVVEDTDPDGLQMHIGALSRAIIRYPGIYELEGGVGFAPNATGSRGCAWMVNGVVVNGSDIMVPTVTTASTSTRVAARGMSVRLNTNDYVELGAFQNSGATLATVGGGAAASDMVVRFVRV
jgi:hypothetical protein